MAPKRFASGMVVGKFAPLHRGHQRLIEAAQEACGRVIVMLWSTPDFPDMPTETRAGWVRALYPDVTVLAFASGGDGAPPPNDAPGEVHRAFVRQRLPFAVEAVFTGGEAYGTPLAEALGAEHVIVDRREDGFSGTSARVEPLAPEAGLNPLVRGHFVQKVAFLGAESSGKSTLAQALAEATGEPYVEEVGRTLWVAAGGDLPLADYETICREHVALEDAAVQRADRFVFVDTNAITTQQYAFFFFGTCPPEVQAYAARCRQSVRAHVRLRAGHSVRPGRHARPPAGASLHGRCGPQRSHDPRDRLHRRRRASGGAGGAGARGVGRVAPEAALQGLYLLSWTPSPTVIFVDVDDTFVRSASHARVPMPEVIEAIRRLHREDAALYCWGSGGAHYAQQSAEEFGVAECFAGFLPKPHILIDDVAIINWRRLRHVHPNEVSEIRLCDV